MIPLARLRPAPADRELPSPNRGSRGGSPIRLIVLHATADNGDEAGAEAWMRNPASQVSAHLHIRRDGSVTRLVDDADRAWHAGRSSFPGVGDVNSESLGWEIANRNDGRELYTAAQYQTIAHLLRHYLPQGLDEGDVVSHAMIAPGRKTDPLGWDWERMWALYALPAPAVVPEPVGLEMIPPNLERILVPDRRHLEAAARVRGKDPERMSVLDWAEVTEAVFRIAVNSGFKTLKPAADVLAEVVKAAR